MAYFPNGSSAEILDNQCEECIHGLSNDVMCPVYQAQIHFNYDQVRPREKKLRTALNILINEKGICQVKAAFEQVRYMKTADDDISELERYDRDIKLSFPKEG